MGKIKSWVLNHKLESVLLLAILIIGAFSRLYKIDQYLTFLGDEGRDVIIVRRIFTELHPPLIGPGTSIGNMYLGPLYYYMMAIPLLIANFNPVGPAIFIAILGVITIWFLWYVIREWFGKKGALVASFLYAISPVVIIYSRSSWNPNIMPFFALLTIYSIWKVFYTEKRRNLWLIITSISFACVIQSHYLGLLILPVVLFFWFMTFISLKEKKGMFIKYSIIAFIIFLILMSPLAIFDIRHNFMNFNAMKAFFTDRQTTVSVLPWKAIPGMWPIFNNITTDIVAAKNMQIGTIISVAIAVSFLLLYIARRRNYDKKEASTVLILTLWIFMGLLGLGLYKQNIYDHYYGFIFPGIFILMGLIFQNANKLLFKVLAVVFFALIIFADYQSFPLRFAPNMQMQRAMDVASLIKDKANGQRLNIATISERNNRDVYQYFLGIWGAKIVDVDPNATKYTVTDQLFVICEKPKEKCDPTHDPSAWITGFGWSKIADSYSIDGLTIFKLGHSK